MKTSDLVAFLNQQKTPIIEKRRHDYLSYYGLEERYVYILFQGIVKTSIIQKNGREFNLSYIKGPDIISLLKDEVSNFTSSPFNIRVESPTASFYRVPRTKFWDYVRESKDLQDYIRNYYRNKLSENMASLQYMTMYGKTGAVCALLCRLIEQFGREREDGAIAIELGVTNEDIAAFCGISTRNSVNRILHNLKMEEVLHTEHQQLIITNKSYLYDYIGKEE